MTDQPGLTPPSSEPTSPAWGAAADEQPEAAVPPLAPAPAPSYAPPAPPAYGVPVTYQPVTGTETHQGGLWAMILGIVGLASAVLSVLTSGITAVGMICSPVALGLGLWSSRQIRDRPDVYNNRGQAIAGWIMGLIGIVLALLALLLVLAFFGLLIWIFAGAEQ